MHTFSFFKIYICSYNTVSLLVCMREMIRYTFRYEKDQQNIYRFIIKRSLFYGGKHHLTLQLLCFDSVRYDINVWGILIQIRMQEPEGKLICTRDNMMKQKKIMEVNVL